MKTKENKQAKRKRPISIRKEKDLIHTTQEFPNFNNVECVRVGEISIQSEVLRADVLLGLAVGLLENKKVLEYLGLINKKKSSGSYLG